MNIYVGNLAREVTEPQLKEAFEKFGVITSASVIKDKFSGESKGFGFVEMPNKPEAEAAIRGLNGVNLGGKSITVNEARPRTENGPRQGRGGRGRFGGGGGGGRRESDGNRF